MTSYLDRSAQDAVYPSQLLTAVCVGLMISFALETMMKRAEMVDLEMHGVW